MIPTEPAFAIIFGRKLNKNISVLFTLKTKQILHSFAARKMMMLCENCTEQLDLFILLSWYEDMN